MASSVQDVEPASLDKAYSWEIESRPPLGDDATNDEELRFALMEETRKKQRDAEAQIRMIDEYYSSSRPEDEELFDAMRLKLLEAMKKFHSLNLSHTEQAPAPPTGWKDVEAIISEIQTKWDTKAKQTQMGRVKSFFRKLCSGLHNHSAALKMLPAESEYVSIVAGAVTMILKASANYEKIISSFTEGIIDINDAVGTTQKETFMYQTPALTQLTMRLYTHVFSYLIRFMTWFTDRSRKRFLNSFNENLNQIFEQDLANVRKICSLISRQISIHIAVDAKAARLYSEAAYENTRFLLELREAEVKDTQVRDAANADFFQQVLRQSFVMSDEELAQRMQHIAKEYFVKTRQPVTREAVGDMLEQQAFGRLPAMQLAPCLARISDASTSGSRTPAIESETGDEKWPLQIRGDDVKLWSAQLEDYFDREHALPFIEDRGPLLADSAFLARLKSFTLGMESQILYAHGEYQDADADILRQSAAEYVSLCRRSSIPVVSHFCSLSSEEAPPNRTRETVELTGLLYSMIRQIIDMLPTDLSVPAAMFSPRRFDKVDGTLRTWDEALGLFTDLVRHVKLPVLVFVVDRINVLEVGSEDTISGRLEAFVDGLQSLITAAGDAGQTAKVLFTTAGLSPCLCKKLDVKETVGCITSSSGRASKVRRSLEQFSLAP